MTKLELLKKLKSEISENESVRLRSGNELSISSYNRTAMLDMLDDKTQWVGQVEASRVEMLRKVTNDYLSIYLADKPEAWKWIFLSCTYNSFIREIPMPPQEFVKYQTIVIGDKILYVCPSKSLDPNTSCAFCVCGKLLGEGTQTFDVEIQD